MGKWLIPGTKHHRQNLLQSLKYSSFVKNIYMIWKVHGNNSNPLSVKMARVQRYIGEWINVVAIPSIEIVYLDLFCLLFANDNFFYGWVSLQWT